MGVLQLWNILEPVKRTGDLSSLNGKILCVDLSVWICEAHGAKGLKSNVLKPHLRNLFFRVWNLIRAGVKLVFVADGDPPKVKWEAILKRTQARNGFSAGRGKDARGPPRKKVGRSNFRVWVNECIAMLKLLGVPYVESAGEAEALCAWMDGKGLVDGCITNDGDVFLYGGKTVYKGLCISTKECSVDCYSMDDIEAQLGLSRKSLISLAILLGCDYLPQGVPGVGKEMGLKLIHELNGLDVLERFNQWSTFQITDADMSKIEKSVKQKALRIPGFPNREVISEFLSPKLKTQNFAIPQGYNCPNLKGMQDFCFKYLEWPEDYTAEKVLPLVTYWHMDRPLEQKKNNIIIPERIVKPRVQNRIECYEVLWKNENVSDTCQSTFTTIENKQMVDKVYTGIVQDFEAAQLEKKTKKQGKRKGKKTSEEATKEEDLDSLCENLETLSLVNPTMTATQAVRKEEKDISCHQETTRNNTNSQVSEEYFVDEEIGNATSKLDSFEIPLPLSKRLAQKKKTFGKVEECKVDEKECNEIDEASKLSSDSFEMPLSERTALKASTSGNVEECKVDGKRCNEMNVIDEASKVLSDSFEIPLPLSERIALKASTSGKVEEHKMDGKRNKETHGIIDDVHKSPNRNVPINSKEDDNSQHSKKAGNKIKNTKRKPNVLHCVEFSSSESDGEDSWLDDATKESSKVPSSTSKPLSKESISGLTEKVDSLNVKRESSSWLDDATKESSKVPSSASKTLSKESISGFTKKVDSLNVNRESNSRDKKASYIVLKEGLNIQKLKQQCDKQSNISRKSVLSSSVDVNLVVKGKETVETFNGSSSNPEESSVLLLTPEISRIKGESSKMFCNHDNHNPVSKPVQQEFQSEETKPDLFDDVFVNEKEIVLITPEKPGNTAGKVILNNTKSFIKKKSASANNRSLKNYNQEDEEKENTADSPLFVPLPLSERIRILRESQTH